MRGAFTKNMPSAFHRTISKQNVNKAYMITLLSATVVCVAVFLMCVLDPECTFIQLFFEVISAFGTVGLSTGITPHLELGRKAGTGFCHVYRQSGRLYPADGLDQPAGAERPLF